MLSLCSRPASPFAIGLSTKQSVWPVLSTASHVARDQLALRNGTLRNIGLQENGLEALLFGASTQGYLFAQAIVAGTKPLLKLGLLKPVSHAALPEAWCWSVRCGVETWGLFSWFSKGCCRCHLSA